MAGPTVAGTNALKPELRFTYAEYVNWQEKERWELIHGLAYSMSPAPRTDHQRLQFLLAKPFVDYFEGKPCQVFFAPFDVVLPNPGQSPGEADTVVQPDLVVFCETERLTEAGAVGAPDLAVEILSPFTSHKDLTEKLDLYETHGVKEYWIFNPQGRYVLQFSLGTDGRYTQPLMLRPPSVLVSTRFPNLEVGLARVFG